MARQQVLSTLTQNHSRPVPSSSSHKTQQQGLRMRSESMSSLSSASSHASSRKPQANDLFSPSASPDENGLKRERTRFSEMFSPVRAFRAARVGMKRKRGGGPVAATRTDRRASAAAREARQRSTMIGKETQPEDKRTIRVARRRVSREASNSSLQRGMKAMVLTDNDTEVNVLRSATSARKVSASGSVRSTRSRMQRQGREESDDETLDDAQEDERLLLQAPSWQLHRLKKTKLFKFHVMLGTWEGTDVVDMDLFNKQELVEGIIKARSSKSAPIHLGDADEEEEKQFATSPASLKEVPRRSSTVTSFLSHSSAYTDDDNDASGTEAIDGGGEETEVEPMKSARRRREARISRQRYLQSGSSPVKGRLRAARSRLPPPLPAEVRFAREGQAKGSISSGVSSPPLARRLRASKATIFASSPVRTRMRLRNQPSNGMLRLSLPTDRNNTAHKVFARRDGITLTPKQRKHKHSAATTDAMEGDDCDEWEDASPTVARRRSQRPPRRAKVRALHQLHVQEAAILAEEVNMSVDETPTKAGSKKQLLSKEASDSDDETFLRNDRDAHAWEAETQLSETDINASPSKMRKLRNGKVRLCNNDGVVDRSLGGDDGGGEEEDEVDGNEDKEGEEGQDGGDIDMEDALSSTEVDSVSKGLELSSLNRMRRHDLLELCEHRRLVVAQDATRACLIDALLEGGGRMSETHEKGSVVSHGTIRPQSSDSARTTRSQGRTASSRRSARRSPRLSDKPLLLRSTSKEVQRSKPASPVPSQTEVSPATGEDELNGLDLESLNLVDKEIPFSKLEKLEKIGSGGFKDVYIGKYQISKKTTKKVAIADIRDQLSEMDIKELTLLRDLKHENIVRFIGVCVPPPDMRMTPCMIVSELCSNGDLFDYIRNVPSPPDEEIFRIMLETARGLEYLHTRTPAIIHRDCKSTNVLVTRNKTAKINDFGLARVRNSKRSMIKSLVGTVNWQAAELWSPKPSYNEKVDVWSAAMTFWETLQWHQPEKKYPFQEMNEHQIYLDVGHRKLRPSTISIRRHYGDEIVELLDKMWEHNAKERPTMTQVCQRLEELVDLKKQARRTKAGLTKAGR